MDRAGDPFWNVPRTTASASVDWTLPLGASTRLDLGLAWQKVGDYNLPDSSLTAPSVDTEILNEGFDRLNFRAKLALDNGWGFTGYVRNVFDSFDYSIIIRNQFAPAPTPDTLFLVPLEPRTFRMIVTKRF